MTKHEFKYIKRATNPSWKKYHCVKCKIFGYLADPNSGIYKMETYGIYKMETFYNCEGTELNIHCEEDLIKDIIE